MSSVRTHLIVASIINLLIVCGLIYLVKVGNDKAIVIFIFGYALLLFVNIMMWATIGNAGRAYMITTIALAVLFLPFWVIAD